MYELIIINAIWATVVAIVLKQILSVKTAEAKLRLAKAEYYRERAKIEKMQKQNIQSENISSIDAILNELGIDLNNPLIKKAIEHYAKKFLEQVTKGETEEEKINFVG